MDSSYHQFMSLLEGAGALMGLSWALMGMVNLCSENRRKGGVYSLLMVLVLTLPLAQLFLSSLVQFSMRPNFLAFHSFPLLIGPVFFLYTKQILNEPLKGLQATGLHFVPFILIGMFEFITKVVTEQPQGPTLFIYLHSALVALSVLIYGAVICLRTSQYQKTVENHFSSREAEITLSWLNKLAIGYIGCFGFSFLMLLFIGILHSSAAFSTHLIAILPLSLFIFYFSYHGTRQKVIVIGDDVGPPIEEGSISEEQSKEKYQKSALANDELQALSLTLKSFMSNTKAYLDSDLTLEKLALQTEIPRHKLSQALNRQLELTFYSFVNQYRLGEFEALVKEGEHKKLSILDLAYECGFKSSSSFYSTMKKEKGKTPKQLIKEISPDP